MARTPLMRGLLRLLQTALGDLDARSGQGGRLDRRQAAVLGAGTLAGLAATLACERSTTATSAALDDGMALKLDHGVAVVGAGVAGLTVAYRLAKANVGCRLYEAGARVGGRMWTEPGFNADGQFIERGGELVDDQHADLIQLCGELGLALETFAGGDVGLAHDVFYAGGAVRTQAQVIAAFAPLALKLVHDRGVLKGPDGAVTVPTYDSPYAKLWAVQQLDQTTLAAYLEAAGIDGWLKDLLNVAYVGEYGRETAEQSALNLLTLITPETTQGFHIFGDSNEARRVKGGSEGIPRTLLGALGKAAPVSLGLRLVRVRDAVTNLVLTFADGAKTTDVKASVAVLALPFTMLREVEGLEKLGLSPAKLRCIRELGYGTNAKLMLGFKSRPWRTGAAASNGTVITTQASQAFWETSRLQPGASGILTNFLGGEAGRLVGAGRPQLALADLEVLFPGTAAQFDGKAVLQHWASAPFVKASYSCPLPGQYTSIWGAGGESELGGRLLCCGEHASNDFGGYMNGAIASGNLTAGQLLKSLGLTDGRSAARPMGAKAGTP